MLLLLLLVAAPHVHARSSHAWPQPIEALERVLYDFELEAASAQAQGIAHTGLRHLYFTHACFLGQVVRPSAANRSAFDASADRASSYFEDQPATEFHRFAQAELALERAVVHVLEGENWTAAWQLRRCWALAASLRTSQHPAPARLLGLFEVCLAALPNRYQWLLDWVGLRGNLTDGTRLLAASAQAPTFFRIQAQVLQVHVLRQLHGQPDRARELVRQQQQAHPTSVLWNYLLAQLEVEQLRGMQAEALLRAIEADAPKLPFIWWLMGRVALGKADLSTAENAFIQFEKNYHGQLYRHDIGLRRAWVAGQQHNRAAVEAQLLKASRLPHPLIDEDRSALKTLKLWRANSPTSRQTAWLKLRWALEGGWAEQAQELLTQLATQKLGPDEQTEWHYRQARLDHKQGRTPSALSHYRKTRAQPAPTNAWMQAASWLYEGLLHEQERDYTAAAACYRALLAYRDHPYQASLEQKAQAGLLRVADRKRSAAP